jgi:hypothetical protein
MTPYRAPRIECLRALHLMATETRNYEEWLEAVRAILKHLPVLWDEGEESARRANIPPRSDAPLST